MQYGLLPLNEADEADRQSHRKDGERVTVTKVNP
jgi:hypothetical protein